MVTYEKLVSKGEPHVHKNSGCVEYLYDGRSYLTKDEKILCYGKYVWYYYNGDYKYISESGHSVLMREGKVLYRTESKQRILSRTDKPNNTRYTVDDLTYTTIKELNFPFNQSVLDIIDNKLKKNHDL